MRGRRYACHPRSARCGGKALAGTGIGTGGSGSERGKREKRHACREASGGIRDVAESEKPKRNCGRKSYQRVNRLYEAGVVSAQKRDEAKAQYDAMTATERAGGSPIHHGAKRDAAGEDKLMAQAKVRQARRCCGGSQFLHQRNVSHGICRWRSDGDIP